MEDLFSNPHSDIPDALWKSASPMERQLAAVEYWAELRGINKIASNDPEVPNTLKRRIRKLLVHPHARDALSAGIVGSLAAGSTLLATRKKPQSESLRVSRGSTTNTPTAEQLELRAERAALEERKKRGNSGPVREKVQDIKERLADFGANNRAAATLLSGATGAGATLAYRRFKKR